VWGYGCLILSVLAQELLFFCELSSVRIPSTMPVCPSPPPLPSSPPTCVHASTVFLASCVSSYGGWNGNLSFFFEFIIKSSLE